MPDLLFHVFEHRIEVDPHTEEAVDHWDKVASYRSKHLAILDCQRRSWDAVVKCGSANGDLYANNRPAQIVTKAAA